MMKWKLYDFDLFEHISCNSCSDWWLRSWQVQPALPVHNLSFKPPASNFNHRRWRIFPWENVKWEKWLGLRTGGWSGRGGPTTSAWARVTAPWDAANSSLPEFPNSFSKQLHILHRGWHSKERGWIKKYYKQRLNYWKKRLMHLMIITLLKLLRRQPSVEVDADL